MPQIKGQNVYVGGRAVSVVTQVACDNQHGQRQDGRTEHRAAGPMKDTTGRIWAHRVWDTPAS
jgi:hypothetical protein